MNFIFSAYSRAMTLDTDLLYRSREMTTRSVLSSATMEAVLTQSECINANSPNVCPSSENRGEEFPMGLRFVNQTY